MKVSLTFVLLQWSALATAALNIAGSGSGTQEFNGLEVTITPNGTATAGETSFSLSCCVTLPQWMQTLEKLTIQFIIPDTLNNSDYSIKNSSTEDTHISVLQFTTLKTSHGGEYNCTATFNSTFIIAQNTTTFNVQIPTPTLTITRDPDASVTLRHGDPLNLTCTIQLDPAVDSDVVVTGELRGPGGSDENVVIMSERRYNITVTVPSLNDTPSDTYTCNATIEPGSGVVNVLSNKDGYNTLDITVELRVIITISYTPPPGVVLGPNEYRAASGPVTVTCTVMGASGPVSYQWSSTCRDCPFKEPDKSAKQSIIRAAVHSGDNGTHTCSANNSESNGNASVDFLVVGAGIHVFVGNRRASLPNNGLITSLNESINCFTFRFFCRSDSIMENVGVLIGLNERNVTNDDHFVIINSLQPGELIVENSTHHLTEREQGIYTCRIPLNNETIEEINIAPPVICSLIFTPGNTSSTLTCTSTGSPATNVTWMRDGVPLAINGTYQLTQTVTNRTESTYKNVLTINDQLSNIVNFTYDCIVLNALEMDIYSIEVSSPEVTITPNGTATAGETSFSLSCCVTLPQWMQTLEKLTIQFITPVTLNNSDYSIKNSSTEDTHTSVLQFTTLKTSHGGEYNCTATFNPSFIIVTAENSITFIVQIPTPTLTISRDPDGNMTLRHGDALNLTCTIQLDPAVDSDVVVTGELSGPGGSDNNVTKISERKYQIRLTTISLNATPSDTYSCNTTIQPSSDVVNVLPEKGFSVLNITVDPLLMIDITINGSTTIGTPFCLHCSVTLPQWTQKPTMQFIRPNQSAGDSQLLETLLTEIDDSNITYTLTLHFSLLQIVHMGHYSCIANLGSQMDTQEFTLNVQFPTPSVSIENIAVSPIYAGSSLILVCIITLDGVTTLDNTTVTSAWKGPHGDLAIDRRIVFTNASDCSYTSTMILNPLYSNDTGNYSCQASVNSNIINSSDFDISEVVITVETPILSIGVSTNGSKHVGEMYSISCYVTGADDLNANFSIEWKTENNTVVTNYSGNNNILTYTFAVKESEVGLYLCKAIVTSPYLDRILALNCTHKVTGQIPIPVIKMSRNPDASVTLKHGSSLNITCTIEVNPVLDTPVRVNGKLSGPGIVEPSTVMRISNEEKYQIMKTISLVATVSATYNCTASITPMLNDTNILASEEVYNVLNVTVELNVTISISYTLPPGVVLGPNEYRAASGPVNVTCTVIGPENGLMYYKWSSTCRNCDFNSSNLKLIMRGAVHSGDTGNHTCKVTANEDEGIITGSDTIDFNVVDAGIHVFVGMPKGSFPNNGVVSTYTDHKTFRLRFFCRSDSMKSVGKLIGLDGHRVNTSDNKFLEVSNPQPGELIVQNSLGNTESLLPGVYACHIPLESGQPREINIGIYQEISDISITSVTFTSESSSSTLTCISTGSPPTTVIWNVEDQQTEPMRDGDSITINETKYQLKQTVTDRRASTYTNELNINSSLVGNISEYSCTVLNVRGNYTKGVEASANISTNGTLILGNDYILTCNVFGIIGTTEYSWCGPKIDENSQNESQLSLSPVTLDKAGKYTCTANVTSQQVKASKTVTIAIPAPTVNVSSSRKSGDVYAGSVLALTCTITINEPLMSDGNAVMVTSTWIHNGSMLTDTTDGGRKVTVSEAKQNGSTCNYISTVLFNTLRTSDAGMYTCRATISHDSSYTWNGIGSNNKMITIKDPTLMLSLTTNATRLPNVFPHNTFSLTCTATVPEGVVTPKTFTWKRKMKYSEDFEMINTNTTIIVQKINSSQSMLTVTEITHGVYVYQCLVNLTEVAVENSADLNDAITVTPFFLFINIITTSNAIAGESYTLTCIVNVSEGVPDNLTAHWSGPGVGMDSVTPDSVSTQTQRNGSSFTLHLVFNSLRQSYNGQYNCSAHLTPVSLTNTSMTSLISLAPNVTVHITPSNGTTAVVGENLLLHCVISGANNLAAMIIIHWSHPNESIIGSGRDRTLQLPLNNVTLHDAGHYICNATISDSPFLHMNSTISADECQEILIQIPSPMVAITHTGGTTIYSGSSLHLTCSITLDAKVIRSAHLLEVNTKWNGPQGNLTTSTRITVTNTVSISDGRYISTVIFNTLHMNDDNKNYSCQSTISHKSSPSVINGTMMSQIAIKIQAPKIKVFLISNTTRLPNVAPYNTFFFNCTATAPEGVVSPKTFTWWRQSDIINSSLAQIHSNGTIQIRTSRFDRTVSTSMLTVTETTAGNWSYRCNVTLNELINVTNEVDTHPIHVTRPKSPELPIALKVDSVGINSATISWIVTTIAFTPETYVVHYRTSVAMYDSMSDPVESTSFTVTNDKFSQTLKDLTPTTMYFYHVNSTNSNRSVSSQVENFTTGSEASPFPAAAAGGGVAAVLLIVLLCIAIAGGIWWQTKHGKNKVHSKLQTRGPSALDTMISVELIAIEDSKVDNDKSIEISTFKDVIRNSIPVAEFSNHVSRMHMDENGFEFEYNSISKEPLASYDVSQISRNKARNRFLNIYPYDFSRVKLKEIEGVEGSDYINASFLNGYVKENEYIAAQGPVPESVGDFWRMVWEYKLTTIVMLTKCEERGKRKCEQYWPDKVNQTIEPGFNLMVTLTTLLPLVEYEIRKFTVTDLTNPKEPAREVTHFYYLSWPDHGVPTDSTSLINFIKRVRKVQPHSTEVPLLVHCSAGVGRTGTFFAIDIEMQRIEAEGVVDVYGCLKKLRSQRILMVQTLTQYVFIHEALNELILCGRTDIPAANLRIVTNRMRKIVPGKLVTGFKEQFEILEQLCVNANKNFFSEATNPSNLSKNRYPAVVAGNQYRVRLKHTGAIGSDYINANFINGYRQPGAYIATQGPMASTVKDFWRMMWEHQSKCIVMLCSVQEEGEESCYPYWPDKQGITETHGKIAVTLLSEEDFGNCIIRKLEVVENTKFTGPTCTGPATVTQFHFLRWPRFEEPSPPSSLLDVMENLTTAQMATGNRTITVMCNDGVSRTGAFICLHAQLERLKTEGVVDCFQFIKSARLNRPGLVQSVGQYILCHDVLTDFVDSFDTYANFKEVV